MEDTVSVRVLADAGREAQAEDHDDGVPGGADEPHQLGDQGKAARGELVEESLDTSGRLGGLEPVGSVEGLKISQYFDPDIEILVELNLETLFLKKNVKKDQ